VPARIESTAFMVAGAASMGGIVAVMHRQAQKIFQNDWSRSISENEGEMIWQQAKRETRRTRKSMPR